MNQPLQQQQSPPPLPVQAGGQQQQHANIFALDPAAAMGHDTLDFTIKLHKVHFYSASKSLHNDKEDKFNLSEDRLQDFLTSLKEHTDSFVLSTVDAPINLTDPINSGFLNYIDSHGQFETPHLRNFVATFIGQPNRAAQDDVVLHQLLMASMTHEDFGELTCNEDECIHTVGNQRHKSGLLLLASVITESAANASIDPDTICKEHSHASLKFCKLKHDVEQFNAWVSLKVKQLRHHRQESTDLRTHLMSAHWTAEDKEFVAHINALKDDIRDNRWTLTPKELMSKAKKKVEDLDKERKFDGLRSNKVKTILALEACIQQLEQTASSMLGSSKRCKEGKKP